MLEQLFLYQLI